VENLCTQKRIARVLCSLSLKDDPKEQSNRERKKDDDIGERVFSREREEREEHNLSFLT